MSQMKTNLEMVMIVLKEVYHNTCPDCGKSENASIIFDAEKDFNLVTFQCKNCKKEINFEINGDVIKIL